ncbi:MAG: hypothetical protein ACREPQ_17425 [Rhodanobacter sp.]
MNTAIVPALAALTGSAIGGLTSLCASWITQAVQFRAQERTAQLSQRQELYRNFIEEASRWYADAYEHDTPKVTNLVDLYAMVSRMRVLSAPDVVEHADLVVRAIIKTYLSPNKTFQDITEHLDNRIMDPLASFSTACREELWGTRRMSK